MQQDLSLWDSAAAEVPQGRALPVARPPGPEHSGWRDHMWFVRFDLFSSAPVSTFLSLSELGHLTSVNQLLWWKLGGINDKQKHQSLQGNRSLSLFFCFPRCSHLKQCWVLFVIGFFALQKLLRSRGGWLNPHILLKPTWWGGEGRSQHWMFAEGRDLFAMHGGGLPLLREAPVWKSVHCGGQGPSAYFPGAAWLSEHQPLLYPWQWMSSSDTVSSRYYLSSAQGEGNRSS